MSADIQNHQMRLFSGVAILAIVLLLALGVIFQSVQSLSPDPQIGHRSPAARLTYCAPDDPRLCVVSFSQLIDGNMQVHFKLPRTLYPEFTLVINRYGVESIYECERTEKRGISVACTGASQVPGEVLQFKVFSQKQGFLMAEGKFPIIGIALATPEFLGTETTETIEPSAVPETTETPMELFPTPTVVSPTPPSYPNPSYPNPTAYP